VAIENVSETLKRELPALLRDDPDFRRYVLELTRGEYAGRQQTEDRFDRVLDELRRDREANDRKWWEAQEEQKRKWEENRADFKRVHEEIMAQAEKHERHIGALGSRWGLQSEATFRNALAGILEKNFDLDIIIKNGLLLICELKSSIDKGGMYLFECKARFYERHHNHKADRLIVISPMIDKRAKKLAKELGIEIYSDSLEVEEI